jgi:peptidyl-prolyl cis-trans isomerase C
MTAHHYTPGDTTRISAASELIQSDVVASDVVATNESSSIAAIRVNHRQISGESIAAEMQYHPAETKREAMFKAAETLIIGELLRQRAEALQLQAAAEPDEDLLDLLLEVDVATPVATDQECALYYQANAARFMTSPLLELHHILLAAAPDDDEARVEAKLRAQQLVELLQQGADFSTLALQESACPSRATRGSLGQISRGQTVPEFERQVFAANPGLLPHPIESRYGVHVVWIERKIPGEQLPYSAVKDRIAGYLGEKVRTKAVAQYIRSLIAQAEIEGYSFDVSKSPLVQ